MLIAIMSDIYEETTDKRPRSKRQTELDKMSAYVDLIVQDDKDKTFGFFFSPKMYMSLHYGWFKVKKTKEEVKEENDTEKALNSNKDLLYVVRAVEGDLFNDE